MSDHDTLSTEQHLTALRSAMQMLCTYIHQADSRFSPYIKQVLELTAANIEKVKEIDLAAYESERQIQEQVERLLRKDMTE